MIRLAVTLTVLLAGVISGLLITAGVDELDLPPLARWLALAGVVVLLYALIRLVTLLVLGLRQRRRIRRARAAELALVDTRLAEVRELRPTAELDRAVDPTPGTIRRARQSRGKRTPRARKRRTGRWG
jgi:hypothetical protein